MVETRIYNDLLLMAGAIIAFAIGYFWGSYDATKDKDKNIHIKG